MLNRAKRQNKKERNNLNALRFNFHKALRLFLFLLVSISLGLSIYTYCLQRNLSTTVSLVSDLFANKLYEINFLVKSQRKENLEGQILAHKRICFYKLEKIGPKDLIEKPQAKLIEVKAQKKELYDSVALFRVVKK